MSSAKSTEILEQHSHSSQIMLNNYGTGFNEIEEVDDSIETINHHFDDNIDNEIEEEEEESCVYVAVGKSNTSMEALSWTLNNLFTTTHSTNTILYLIHVFPEIKHIPNPCNNFSSIYLFIYLYRSKSNYKDVSCSGSRDGSKESSEC